MAALRYHVDCAECKRRVYVAVRGKAQANRAARWHVRHLHDADAQGLHHGIVRLAPVGRGTPVRLVMSLLDDGSKDAAPTFEDAS